MKHSVNKIRERIYEINERQDMGLMNFSVRQRMKKEWERGTPTGQRKGLEKTLDYTIK